MGLAMQQQARAARTQPFGAEAFGPGDDTVLRWLGMAGFLVNSRGTTLMLDPLLGGFDMPVMVDFPITADAVPRLDAVLVTHSDSDHFSVATCRQLAPVTARFHSTRYVDTLMRAEGFPSTGHDIGDRFAVALVQVSVTPADHAWQNESPGASDRIFQLEDCCGFWLDTPDGSIWAPGDSRLIPDHYLQVPAPGAMLFDFSDSECTWASTGRSPWPTPTPRRRCCSSTGAASTHPASPPSTPTPPPLPTGSSTPTASSS